MRVSVVIAARDEAAAIADVVAGCLAAPHVAEVVVVDDGSTDATATLAEAAGARVLVCRPGGGKGAAVCRGVGVATGDVVVLLDGDGQDPPADIPRLLDAMAHADLVVGSRFLGRFEPGAITAIDAAGNRALTWVFGRLFGARFTDTMAGFKAIRRPLFVALPLRARRFDIEAELLGRAVQAGARIVEVPVTRKPRVAGASRLRRIADGLRIVRAMVRVAATPRAVARG